MRTWARNAWTGIGVAERRADLWLPGALAWLVYLGWIPLVVTLVPLPDAGDLAFLAARLVPTGGLPVALIAIAAAIVGAMALVWLAAAAAEVAIQRAISDRDDERASSGVAATLRGLAILIIASIPAAVAAFGFGTSVAQVAPIEYTSPRVETPILLRIAAALLPWEVAVVIAIVLGQALGATALQRSLAPPGIGSVRAIGWAVADLLRHPLPRLTTSLVIAAADLVVLLVNLVLLRVLWAPVADDLARGRLATPGTILLLVGFMAIWLALLLLSGALHAAASCWWRLEVRGGAEGHGFAEPARAPEGGAG